MICTWDTWGFINILSDDAWWHLLILCFGREWTGDLKKLPNIKLRKVSNKGSDTKHEEEEKHEAEDDNEKDEDDLDDELDEMVLMSDSNWGSVGIWAPVVRSGQLIEELNIRLAFSKYFFIEKLCAPVWGERAATPGLSKRWRQNLWWETQQLFCCPP